MALAAGTTFGVYRITALIGAGGMGEVYRARDTRHERDVALKVLPPGITGADRMARFTREIGVLSSLAHPHIVPLFDSGESGGRLYFAMPLIEGETLRRHIDRQGPLGMSETARLVSEIAGALDYAHQRGVVHRDLKPDNVLLHEGHAVIADFGLARAVSLVDDGQVTESGVAIGTPAYMSPEQAAGGSAGPRSDIYALGCVTFEVLSGVPPYTGPSRESIARQHITAPVPDLSMVRGGTSRATAEAVRTAMAKAPADRFATAEAFARAIQHGAERERTAEQTAPMRASRRFRRVPALLIALLGALAIGFVAQRLLAMRDAGPAKPSRAPDWLIVAQFDGASNEPGLATTVRELVVSGLDQSQFVITVPDDRIQQGLAAAGKPDSTRITPALARELAARYSIGSVLEGHVARIGSSAHVTLRLSQAINDSTLEWFKEGTSRDADLVGAVDHLVRRLREFLGENRSLIRSAPTLEEILTPSYEAFRLIDRGTTYLNATQDGHGALRLDRDALALDPDCAYAFWQMAYCFRAMGLPDSAAWACDQALARSKRLTPAQRLLVAAERHTYSADLTGGLDLVDQALGLYPKEAIADGALDTRDACLGWMARGAQSRPSSYYGVPDPEEVFGPNPTLAWNRFFGSTMSGRFARSESLLTTLSDSQRLTGRLCLAAYESRWELADSLAMVIISSERGFGTYKEIARAMLRDAHACLGEVANAESVAVTTIRGASRAEELYEPERARLLASQILGTTPGPPSAGLMLDTATAGLVTQAWYSARIGDAQGLRRLEGALRRRSPDDLRRAGAAFEFLDASLAAHERRWADVVSILALVARSGSDLGAPEWRRIGPQPEQWLVGEAFLDLGHPDSAVTYFNLVAHPIGGLRWAGESFAAATYAHQRLALAYARLGRRADAQREWAEFRASFLHPDPSVRHWIAECEAELRLFSILTFPWRVAGRAAAVRRPHYEFIARDVQLYGSAAASSSGSGRSRASVVASVAPITPSSTTMPANRLSGTSSK